MAYELTFTPRFQKHFKGLSQQEKKQPTSLNAASIWMFALSGTMRAVK